MAGERLSPPQAVPNSGAKLLRIPFLGVTVSLLFRPSIMIDATQPPNGVKIRPTRRSLSRFAYFAECEDDKRLPEIPMDSQGWTAAECFHAKETFGHLLPCREPVLLTRALNGKQWHGLNVTNCAEDYIGRVLFASELKASYPEWVRADILGRARQIARRDLGYVPTYILTGEDFSTGPLTQSPRRLR
jgi:hypothetical protein